LSVQEVDLPPTEPDLMPFLLGHEVYRRTDYIVVRNGGDAALAAVRNASTEPLLSPVVQVPVLAAFADRLGLAAPDLPWITARARFAEFVNLLAMGTAALVRPRGRCCGPGWGREH
jgi:hypothetical protein